jgi:hypothetical protein
VGLHYSINKPVVGVGSGDVNVDLVNSLFKVGNDFVYVDDKNTLKPGDTINYWLITIDSTTGAGHNILDRHFTYTGPPSTTPQPTTKAPTPAPTTRETDPPIIVETDPPAIVETDPPVIVETDPPIAGNTPISAQTAKPGTGLNQGGTGPSNGACGCSGTEDKYDKSSSCTSFPCLIFDEEFDEFDLELWEHEITANGGGNWEFQYYTNNRSNSYVNDGKLFIKPTLTSERFGEQFLTSGELNLWGAQPADVCTGNIFWGCQRQGRPGGIVNPIQSARLRTAKSFNFKYGRLEIEAKMPVGDWIWPAIWLLPRYQAYGQWPASGEIDLVESRGNLNLKDVDGKDVGVQSMGSTLHFGPYTEANMWSKAHASVTSQSGTFADSFHKYRLDWDENAIKFFVDDKEILSVDPGKDGFWGLGEFEKSGNGHYDNPWAGRGKMAPFDQEFHLVLNVAVGGTAYFPDTLQNSPYPKPWHDKVGHAQTDFWNSRGSWLPTWKLDQNNGESAAMQVNYVKVWKLKPDP